MTASLLYRLVWEYRERWRVAVPRGGHESMGYAYVEGVVRGRLNGRFRGTNHARQRSDGRFLVDAQGVIISDASRPVLVDFQGYGCPYPRTTDPIEDRTRVVVSARHSTDDPEWEFLNDSIAIGVGENRFTSDGIRLLILDIDDVVWSPLVDAPTTRPHLASPVEIGVDVFDLEAIAADRGGLIDQAGRGDEDHR